MEYFLLLAGFFCMLFGIVGSLLPALPGPPIAFIGLIIQQLRDPNPFTTKFLLIWVAVILLVTLLDYYVPIWGTKKFGGTKYGMWGCTLGFLAAFWMGPLGVVAGPFAGAFIGEMIADQNSQRAMRAAMGAFLGFLGGSLIKILICVLMGYYIIASI
jgi:uncharacterized protein YqgC (DUF456 family)